MAQKKIIEIDVSEEDFNAITNQITKYTEPLKFDKIQLHQIRVLNEKRAAKLLNAILIPKIDNKDLEKVIEFITDYKETLKKSQKLEKEVACLKEENRSLQSSTTTLRDRLRTIEDTYIYQIHEIEANRDMIKNELDSISTEYADAKTNWSIQFKDLEQKLENALNSNKEKVEELNVAFGDINNLKQEIQSLKYKIDFLSKKQEGNKFLDETNLEIYEKDLFFGTIIEIFKKDKIKEEFLSFLEPKDIISLQLSSKFCLTLIQNDPYYPKSIVNYHKNRINILSRSVHDKLFYFKTKAEAISSDYAKTLVYKYLHLKVAPADYMPNVLNSSLTLISDFNKLKEFKIPQASIANTEGNNQKYFLPFTPFNPKISNPFLPDILIPKKETKPSEATTKVTNALFNAFNRFENKIGLTSILPSVPKQNTIQVNTPIEHEINYFSKKVIEKFLMQDPNEVSHLIFTIQEDQKSLFEIANERNFEYYSALHYSWVHYFPAMTHDIVQMLEAILFYYSRMLSYAIAMYQELKEVLYLKDFLASEYEREIRVKQELEDQVQDLRVQIDIEKNMKEFLAKKCHSLEALNNENMIKELNSFQEITLLKNNIENQEATVRECKEKTESLKMDNISLIEEVKRLKRIIEGNEKEKTKMMGIASDINFFFKQLEVESQFFIMILTVFK